MNSSFFTNKTRIFVVMCDKHFLKAIIILSRRLINVNVININYIIISQIVQIM